MDAKKIAAAIALSTLGLIVWGMLFWGLLSPVLGTFRDAPIQAEAARVLAAADTPTGTYFFPWPRGDADWARSHTEGPFFKLSYVREGANPESPTKLAIGSLHNLVVASLATALIRLALPGLASFRRRFAVVFLAGLMGSVLIQVGDPIWFHMPWDYVRGALVYELGTWAIVAAVPAAILRPVPGLPGTA